MVRFCGIVLIGSSVVKFLGPVGPVDYMASMGFEGGTLFLVSVLELLTGVLFLLRNTRALGLLLVSSYFGGAIDEEQVHFRSIVNWRHPATAALVGGF